MKKMIALLFVIPLLARAETSPEETCRTHLKNLAGALKGYRLLHEDKNPPKLADLYIQGLADKLSDFVCPTSGAIINSDSEIAAKSDYELGTGDILIREKAARHDGKALAVMADGSIKPVEGAAPAAAPVAALEKRGSAVASDAPRLPSAATTAPTTVMRESAPTTPSAPTTVMREAAPPPAKKPMVDDTPISPQADDEPGWQVTKSDPGITFDGNASFGDFLGMTFEFQADGKLVIGSVKADSIGTEIGFKAGDEIIEINQKPTPKGTAAGAVTGTDLAKLAGVSAGQSVLVTVKKADGEKVSFSYVTGLPSLRGK